MAYNASKYQLTKLLQDAWVKLGVMKTWKATGGSSTTLVNTVWAGVEDALYEDDDPALIYGTVVIVRDAGGANAAPEGEFGQITDYDSSTQTATIDTVSASIEVGDVVGVASPLFPLQDMLRLANIAVRSIGELTLVDESLTTISGQSEYTLPVSVQKKPKRVRIQGVQSSLNNQWGDLSGWDVVPATAGSNWTLVLPKNTPSGFTIQVVYDSQHPELTTFDSAIADSVDPRLAVSALVAEAYQWYNNQVGGSNEYMIQRENKALQDLEKAKVEFPVMRDVGQVKGFPHWRKTSDYVPLTSDLKA